MFYHVLETLYQEDKFKLASYSDIEILDSYLANLTVGQSAQVSPWRVSNKTAIEIKAIYEVFFLLAQKSVLSIKYELWHPETRIKIFETFDESEIENIEGSEFQEDLPDNYVLRKEDIFISFRLNQVLDRKEENQKKKSSPLTSTPIVSATKRDLSLSEIIQNPLLNATFVGCTFQLGDNLVNSSKDVVGLSKDTITDNSSTVVALNSEEANKENFLNMILSNGLLLAIASAFAVYILNAYRVELCKATNTCEILRVEIPTPVSTPLPLPKP
jgi:hypothetical protein